MKKYLILFILLISGWNIAVRAESTGEVIRISTDRTDLIYRQAPNGRLYQVYLGPKLMHQTDLEHFSPFAKGGSDGSAGQGDGRFI